MDPIGHQVAKGNHGDHEEDEGNHHFDQAESAVLPPPHSPTEGMAWPTVPPVPSRLVVLPPDISCGNPPKCRCATDTTCPQ